MTPGQAPPAYRDVVVGGGPAGCSAGVFDRENAASRRCASLANHLGRPAEVGVDTFQDLMHAHAEDAGCDRLPELVVSVDRDGGGGFVVGTRAGRPVEVIGPERIPNCMAEATVREYVGEQRRATDE